MANREKTHTPRVLKRPAQAGMRRWSAPQQAIALQRNQWQIDPCRESQVPSPGTAFHHLSLRP